MTSSENGCSGLSCTLGAAEKYDFKYSLNFKLKASWDNMLRCPQITSFQILALTVGPANDGDKVRDEGGDVATHQHRVAQHDLLLVDHHSIWSYNH